MPYTFIDNIENNYYQIIFKKNTFIWLMFQGKS